jgi:hypothetical protein
MKELVLAAWMILGVAGCTTFDSGYSYSPRPVALEMTQRPATEERPVHVLATVVGRRTGNANPFPNTIQVALRFENLSAVPVNFDTAEPGGLGLYGGNLKPFAAPIVEPGGTVTVAPGAVAEVTAYFPVGDTSGMDLGGLNLRWRYRLGDAAVMQTATFTRSPVYIERGYDGFIYFGPRVGVIVHRRH